MARIGNTVKSVLRIWPNVRKLGRGLLNLALPPRCLRCDDDLSPEVEISLCLKCIRAVAPELGPCCGRCGAVLPEGLPMAESCPACQDFSLKFDAVYPLGCYEGALRELVLKTKRLSAEALSLTVGRLLAHRLADKLAGFRPDAVLPVPMHWAKRLYLGINSPELLADCLGRKLGVPVVRTLGPLPLYWSSERPAPARAISQCSRRLPPCPAGPAALAGLAFAAGRRYPYHGRDVQRSRAVAEAIGGSGRSGGGCGTRGWLMNVGF